MKIYQVTAANSDDLDLFDRGDIWDIAMSSTLSFLSLAGAKAWVVQDMNTCRAELADEGDHLLATSDNVVWEQAEMEVAEDHLNTLDEETGTAYEIHPVEVLA